MQPPIWKKNVNVSGFAERNRLAIEDENRRLREDESRRLREQDASQPMGVPKMKSGIGTVKFDIGGGVWDERDAEDLADDPVYGGVAHEALWKRDMKSARDEADSIGLELSNPSRRRLSKTERESILAEGSQLQETDPRHKELKSQLVADDEMTAMEQKQWEAKKRAQELSRMGPKGYQEYRQQQKLQSVAQASKSIAQQEADIQAKDAEGVSGRDLEAHQQAKQDILAKKQDIQQQAQSIVVPDKRVTAVTRNGVTTEYDPNAKPKTLDDYDNDLNAAEQKILDAEKSGQADPSSISAAKAELAKNREMIASARKEASEAEARKTAIESIGVGFLGKQLSGKKSGVYEKVKDYLNDVGFGGLLHAAVNPLEAAKVASDEHKIAIDRAISDLNDKGYSKEDAARIVRDAAKEYAWTANDTDRVRSLSDGEIVINPGRVFSDAENIRADIAKSGGDAEKQARANDRLNLMRESMAEELEADLYSADNDFKAFADQWKGDKVSLIEAWSKQQKDRNWIFKAGDAIATGVEGGAVGVTGTVVNSAAGVSALVGADKMAGAIGETGAMIAGAGESVSMAGQQRGLTGGFGVTTDISNTVTQMAPMLVGGYVAQGLKPFAAAVTQGMSVYGWSAAQGYGSKLQDALTMEQEKLDRPLSEQEIAATLSRPEVQIAGFANAAQTAMLSKLLPGGSERVALKGVARKMTVADFLKKGGRAALRDAGLKAELKQMGKTMFADATDEALEEGINQMLDSIISTAALGKDMKLGDLMEESLTAALMGGLVGGVLPQARFSKAERTAAALVAQGEAAPTPEEQRKVDEIAGADADVDQQVQYTKAQREIAAAEPEVAERANATLKLARGASMDELTANEVRALGVTRDGAPLSPDVPALVEIVNGRPIVLDRAIQELEAIAPAAKGLVTMTEGEARTKFSKQPFTVTSKSGAVIQVDAKDAAEAEKIGAQQFDLGDGVETVTLAATGGGGVVTANPPAPTPAGATTAQPVADQTAIEEPFVKSDPNFKGKESAEMPALIPDTLQEQTEIGSKLRKRLGKLITFTNQREYRLNATLKGISINLNRMIDDAKASGLPEADFNKWIDNAIDEELFHVSHIAVIKDQYKKAKAAGETREFEQWRNETYAEKWDNDYVKTGRDKVLVLNKDGSEKEVRAIAELYRGLDELAPWARYMEAMRMEWQQIVAGSPTEASRLDAKANAGIVEHLQKMLAKLKEMLGSLTPAMRREIAIVQAHLKKLGAKSGAESLPDDLAEKLARPDWDVIAWTNDEIKQVNDALGKSSPFYEQNNKGPAKEQSKPQAPLSVQSVQIPKPNNNPNVERDVFRSVITSAVARLKAKFPKLASSIDVNEDESFDSGGGKVENGVFSFSLKDVEEDLQDIPVKDHETRIDAVVDEEITHLAQTSLASKIGKKLQEFFKPLLKSFTENQINLFSSVYGIKFEFLSDANKAVEATRILIQLLNEGVTTDQTQSLRRGQENSKSTVQRNNAVIELKKMLDNNEFSSDIVDAVRGSIEIYSSYKSSNAAPAAPKAEAAFEVGQEVTGKVTSKNDVDHGKTMSGTVFKTGEKYILVTVPSRNGPVRMAVGDVTRTEGQSETDLIEIASESTESIINRTEVGDQRDEAFTRRRSSAVELAKTIFRHRLKQGELAVNEPVATVTPTEKPKKTTGPKKSRIARGLPRHMELFMDSRIGKALYDSGGIMSKSTALQKYGAEYMAENGSNWQDAPTITNPVFNKYIFGSKNSNRPDQVAKALFDIGVLKEDSAKELWAELGRALQSTRSVAEQEKIENQKLSQAEDFARVKDDGPYRVNVDEMSKGDKLVIDGENFTVTTVTRKDGEVAKAILEDGTRFGRQTVEGGEEVWVEEFDDGTPEMTAEEAAARDAADQARVPKPTQDGDAITKAKADAEAAKEAADKAQGKLFDLTAAEKATEKAFEGLFAAPLSESFTENIPADKIGGMINAASQLIADGVRTPEAMAAALTRIEQANGKPGALRKYSEAFWSAFRMVDTTLAKDVDWAKVYTGNSQQNNDTTSNDQSSSSNLESNREDANLDQQGSESSVPTQSGPTGGDGKPVVSGGGRGKNTRRNNQRTDDNTTTPDGSGSDQQSPATSPEPVSSAPVTPDSDGSRIPNESGVEPYGRGDNDAHDGLVQSEASGEMGASRRTIGEIKRSAPNLKVEQAEDVAFVEARLIEKGETGVLLTNGTGTGKTFSGLGVIKRELDRGSRHIAIVAPSDKVVSDWVKTAKQFFGIDDIIQLDGIQDNGGSNRVIVTTYSNFGQNNELVKRPWTMVVTDEAHYLSQAKDGTSTLAQRTFKGLTWHYKDGVRNRLSMEMADEYAEIKTLNDSIEGNNRTINAEVRVARQEENEQSERRLSELRAKIATRESVLKEQMKAMPKASRPKAVFLSATPFAYHFSLDYAEGYLFEHGEDPQISRNNTPSARSKFFMENFGYRMRYNKLTQPENAAATGILERMFAEKLKKSGAMRGRMLSVPFDYSREFVLAESMIGTKIDEIFDVIQKNDAYAPLRDALEIGDYLARRYLLEGLKAIEVVKRVREHLALGRKVVVFHDYKKGGATNPLRLRINDPVLVESYDKLRNEISGFDQIVKALDNLQSPISLFRRTFAEAGIFNGDVPRAERRAIIDKFNTSGSTMNVLLAQRASAKEGISMHDTDGKHQRVFIDLGIPGRPTDAIQSEGRIIRLGMQSNGIIEYLTTGTNFERYTFAQTIATRASTAENLAMGENARALLQAFSTGYNDAAPVQPSDKQGTGGKAMDSARELGDPFDNAVALYFTNQKKTSKTKAQEGVDYFATPEPLGFKMVEWAGIRAGERMLEPSGGHGAIARFFPDSTTRHAVEPSYELAGRLALNAPDTRIHQMPFEDFDVVNKFDAVVMNPPFGTAGKTAMEHLEKAVKHLRNGGRVVALIPMGSAMSKRFDKWYEDVQGVFLTAEILLPSVTFERAGTSVSARIVVLDKIDAERAPQQVRRDYSDAKTVQEFFDRIKDSSIPPRPEPVEAKTPSQQLSDFLKGGRDAMLPSVPTADYSPMEFNHSKTGKPIFVAKINRKLNKDEYDAALSRAKSNGGYYSSFNRDGAIPGFHFKTAEDRDGFLTPSSTLSAAPLSDRDADYMAAVKAGDMETAQAMVDEAARAAGYDRVVWRSDSAQVAPSILIPGSFSAIYTSPSKNAASEFNDEFNGVGGELLRKFYIAAKKTATFEDLEISKSWRKTLKNISGLRPKEVQELKAKGFDSAMGFLSEDQTGEIEIAVFDSNQIKSADPVVRDENGNVIPLSQRFNPKNDSILYAGNLSDRARAEMDEGAIKETMAQQKEFGNVVQPPNRASMGDETTRKVVDAFDIDFEQRREKESREQWVKQGTKKAATGRKDLIENALMNAYGEVGAVPMQPEDMIGTQIVIEQMVQEAGNNYDKLIEAGTIIQAYRKVRGDIARVLASGWDRLMPPDERNRRYLANAILTLPPTIERDISKRGYSPEKTRELIQSELRTRLTKIEKALKEYGVTINEVLGKQVYLSLNKKNIVKDIMAKNTKDEQLAIRMHQQAYDVQKIAKATHMTVTEVQELIDKVYAEALERMKVKARAGATLESLQAAALSEAEVEAEARRMVEIGLGISPTAHTSATRMMKRKAVKIPTEPAKVNWARPEFTSGLLDYSFDTKDLDAIKQTVQALIDATAAKAKVESITDPKQRAKADALLAKLETILAKYGTDISSVVESGKPLESYRFDITDRVHVHIVANAIRSVDADWIDKGTEYAYFSFLSGVQTFAKNLSSVPWTMFEATIQRGSEAIMNLFFKNPMNATFKEVEYMAKAMGPMLERAKSNLIASFGAEAPFFEQDILGVPPDLEKVLEGHGMYHRTAISGRKGRLLRIQTRGLLAVDEYVKTVNAMIEVGAMAYRLCMAANLKPDTAEFNEKLKELVNVPGSLAWQLAAKKAYQRTFTTSLPGEVDPITGKKRPTRTIGETIGRGVHLLSQLSSLKVETKMAKLAVVLFRLAFFPFIKIPYNIIATATGYTPVSMIDIATLTAHYLVDKHKGKKLSDSKDIERHEMELMMKKGEVIERMSKMMLGNMLTALLLGVGWGEGDDDDLEKTLLITGSRPHTETSKGERETSERLGIGAYTISWKKKDGTRGKFYYGGIEPLATILSTNIDTINQVKQAAKGMQGYNDAIGGIAYSFTNQLADKSFLRGFGDLYKFLQGQTDMSQYAADKIGMLMPNLIKQVVRESDPLYREKADSFTEAVAYSLMPIGQKNAKVDIYGEEVKKTGSILTRWIDFTETGSVPVKEVDEMLWRYHLKNPKASIPSSASPTYSLNGKQQKMTENQAAMYRKWAGDYFTKRLSTLNLNYENPSDRDVAKIMGLVSESRSLAKKALMKNPNWK